MNVYFLTGATGAIGSAVVPLLLNRPDTEVRLLIRAGSDAALARRLEALLAFWGFSDRPEMRGRIVALRGDAAERRFALSAPQYERLVAETTHVIHCAASVRMNLPLDAARRSAVGSAQEILALARQIADTGRLQKVEFVSTVGVAGKRPGVLAEAWIDEPREFHNTYEQSKAEAEALVREAIEKDALPVTVHRPSMVIGDSRTGRIIHFQIFYFICEFLSGRKTFGIYPDFGDVRLDVIPVDWVAEALAEASRAPATGGRIFHLCSGPEQAPRIEALKARVRQAFADRGLRIPADRTLSRARFATLARLASRLLPARQRKALATLPIYLDYLGDAQGFGNAGYRAWLADRNRELPPAGAYLPTVLEAYLAARH